ncbi:MAG: hypothetical protein BWZ01_01346 [Deltaproteobacteria bacterium ADurb.BinA179]|nr:MAG: hypothetical protein BWZ01_01346 [Deltaproteobacteria bacterium ADurb.BinA179]
MIQASDLSREIIRAVRPLREDTATHRMPSDVIALPTFSDRVSLMELPDDSMNLLMVSGTTVPDTALYRPASAAAAIFASIVHALTGYLPMAVSSESITASVPSNTALAASVTSARVGRVLSVMDSSIWVAVMTGFAARFACRMSCFWIRGTSSIATSTPRSPLATMTASAASMMASLPLTASPRSILATTKISDPFFEANSLTRLMSRGLRTKERPNMSMPCSRPKVMNRRSSEVAADMVR